MAKQYAADSKEELAKVAKPLIDKYHSHLADANILYLWQENENKDKGEINYGEVKKAGAYVKHLCGADFIMEVYRYGYDKYLMPDNKLALIDNLLSYCQVGRDKDGYPKEDKFGDPVWQVVKPDVKAFYDVVRRNGAWNDSLKTIFHIAGTKEEVSFGVAGEKVEG